jgi:iron complex transport system permease protein
MKPALLVLALVALVGAAVALGPGDVPPLEAWRIVWARLFGGDLPAGTTAVVVFDLRLPRALLALLLGAALGGAGAVTQGLFRNALAEPGVLGISMCAATAAVLGFVLEVDRAALWSMPLLSAAGAAGGLLLLFALTGGARNMVTVLLSGVALGALGAAAITVLLAVHVERWELGIKVMGWLMGSFEGRSWAHLAWGLPPVLVGLGLALWLRRDLDLLHLGPETAASLGLHPGRTRLLGLACIGILVGAATALAGVIGFVGLVVPHVARLVFGPGHRTLLPASLLLGAILVLAVDTLARTVTAMLLPPGVITALIGAPFFLWLLRREEP